MKKYFVLLIIGSTLFNLAVAQTDSGASEGRRGPVRSAGRGGFGSFSGGTQEVVYTNANNLPRFDLDFPGGKPKELARAIEKALGKPLNVVIPREYADAELPPLTVKDVTVVQLFQAIAQASQKQEAFVTGPRSTLGGGMLGGGPNFSFVNTGYGFSTTGEPTENSIWYFHWEKVPSVPGLSPDSLQPQPVCKFYQLAGYLDAGYKVEDITTAIETGWKMLNEPNPPKISYHKDTRLLIAVGTAERLSLIQDVLDHLPTQKPKVTDAPR